MKIIKIILKTGFWVIISVSVIIMVGVKWLVDCWAHLTMEEVIFHLRVPLGGASRESVMNFLLHYGTLMVLLLAVTVALFVLLKRFRKTKWFYMTVPLVYAVLMILSVRSFDKKMGLFSYMRAQMIPSSFIEDNYADPGAVNLTFPEQKRNLIYIYLESMEVTYMDTENGGAFSANVIPELTELAKEGECFAGNDGKVNGSIALYGSTWTMGSMFSQSVGLPLKIEGVDHNYMRFQSSFYPDVKGIGDILQDEGYYNELLIGSKATFGGRKLFFTEHGNYDIFDYTFAKRTGLIPEDYKVWWGYEDEKLFEYAKTELTTLAKSEKPFNLTMLTVDTHYEDGYVCHNCGRVHDFGDQYSNVMACSSVQVSEFIDWIKEQDFYDNTTIVIAGDHPTMDKDFCENVEEGYNRKAFLTIINSAAEPEDEDKYREYSTMDLFPTTLAAMGVEIPGNKLGLGVNLYSTEETLIEKYGIDYCNKEMERRSKFMESLSTIRINGELISVISKRAEIEPVFTKSGLEINFSSKTNFGELEDFKVLEAEVLNEETDDEKTVVLDAYSSEENCYYNETPIKGYNEEDVQITVSLIDKYGNRYEIKDYGVEETTEE